MSLKVEPRATCVFNFVLRTYEIKIGRQWGGNESVLVLLSDAPESVIQEGLKEGIKGYIISSALCTCVGSGRDAGGRVLNWHIIWMIAKNAISGTLDWWWTKLANWCSL